MIQIRIQRQKMIWIQKMIELLIYKIILGFEWYNLKIWMEIMISDFHETMIMVKKFCSRAIIL